MFFDLTRQLDARLRSASQDIEEDVPFQTAALEGGAPQDSLRRELRRYGVEIVTSEGTAFLDLSTADLADSLGRFLTAPAREFLRLRASEETEKFSDDAALLISWDALAGRLATWDTFALHHREHAVTQIADAYYELYLRTYLTGMDNTLIFGDDGRLKGKVATSYDSFVTSRASTRAGAIVRAYREALRRDSLRVGTAAPAYLESIGLRSMASVQPPVR